MDYENDILLPKVPLEQSAEFQSAGGVPMPARVGGRSAKTVLRREAKGAKAKHAVTDLLPGGKRRKMARQSAETADGQTANSDDWV